LQLFFLYIIFTVIKIDVLYSYHDLQTLPRWSKLFCDEKYKYFENGCGQRGVL